MSILAEKGHTIQPSDGLSFSFFGTRTVQFHVRQILVGRQGCNDTMGRTNVVLFVLGFGCITPGEETFRDQ